jgi:hypothetical protein
MVVSNLLAVPAQSLLEMIAKRADIGWLGLHALAVIKLGASPSNFVGCDSLTAVAAFVTFVCNERLSRRKTDIERAERFDGLARELRLPGDRKLTGDIFKVRRNSRNRRSPAV